jgi:hypothetical protein
VASFELIAAMELAGNTPRIEPVHLQLHLALGPSPLCMQRKHPWQRPGPQGTARNHSGRRLAACQLDILHTELHRLLVSCFHHTAGSCRHLSHTQVDSFRKLFAAWLAASQQDTSGMHFHRQQAFCQHHTAGSCQHRLHSQVDSSRKLFALSMAAGLMGTSGTRCGRQQAFSQRHKQRTCLQHPLRPAHTPHSRSEPD